MKKILFLLLLATSISLSGWANENRIHLKKNTKAAERLQTPKQVWDCWHITIECINGFFCADDFWTAYARAEAIANQYCPCPPDNES